MTKTNKKIKEIVKKELQKKINKKVVMIIEIN